MRKNRKIGVVVGVLAFVGMTVWLRALASWRPVKVAASLGFTPAQLQISRDGRSLLIKDDEAEKAGVWDFQTRSFNVNEPQIRAFYAENALPTFPVVSPVKVEGRTISIYDLGDLKATTNACHDAFRLARDGHEGYHTAVSRERGEVYCELFGSIWIWDARTSKLKKRVRFMTESPEDSVFSPDGKWLLAVQKRRDGTVFLRRYEVQSGKMVEIINQYVSGFASLGFSPDGRWFWFAQKGGDFNALRAKDSRQKWQWAWGSDCEGPVKWVSKHRVGMVDKSRFLWRDARNPNSPAGWDYLPGPGAGTTAWTLSFDENWIYAANQKQEIWRWRAR